MKKVLFALLLLAAVRSHAAESVTGPVSGTYVDSVMVRTTAQAAYIYTSSGFFGGNAVWRIDLSTSNAFGRDMLAVALSAMNTGKRIRVVVDVPADCGGTVNAPSCSFGAFIRSIMLLN